MDETFRRIYRFPKACIGMRRIRPLGLNKTVISETLLLLHTLLMVIYQSILIATQLPETDQLRDYHARMKESNYININMQLAYVL